MNNNNNNKKDHHYFFDNDGDDDVPKECKNLILAKKKNVANRFLFYICVFEIFFPWILFLENFHRFHAKRINEWKISTSYCEVYTKK